MNKVMIARGLAGLIAIFLIFGSALIHSRQMRLRNQLINGGQYVWRGQPRNGRAIVGDWNCLPDRGRQIRICVSGARPALFLDVDRNADRLSYH